VESDEKGWPMKPAPKEIADAVKALRMVMETPGLERDESIALCVRRDGRVELGTANGTRKFDTLESGEIVELRRYAYSHDRSDL